MAKDTQCGTAFLIFVHSCFTDSTMQNSKLIEASVREYWVKLCAGFIKAFRTYFKMPTHHLMHPSEAPVFW